MKLEFYVVSDEPRKAQKTLGNAIHTVNNASIYRACSLMTPEFLVDYSDSLMACNYLFAGVVREGTSYGAYYFIKDRIVMPGGRCVIICAKDVLSTWWHSLKNCTANVIRQEQTMYMNKFMFDANMVGKVSTRLDNIEVSGLGFTVPDDGSDRSYVLTVLGGDNNEGS